MVRTRPPCNDWLKSPRRSSSVGTVRTMVTRALVVPVLERGEAEDAVLLDRAADRAAVHLELGAAQHGGVLAGRDRDRRVADRVHAGVAEEHVGRAAQRVGARLHVQADQAAEAVAVLGVDAALGDGDFLDRVHRRRVGRLVAGAERDAIEQHGVGAARAAAGVVVVGVGVMVRAVLRGRRPGRVDDRRIEVRQVVRVAPADRHLVDQRAFERQVGAARIELHERRRSLHGDRFGHRRQPHQQIDGDVAALRHAHGLLRRPSGIPAARR